MSTSDYILFTILGLSVCATIFCLFKAEQNFRGVKENVKAVESPVKKDKPKFDKEFSLALQALGAPSLPPGAYYVLNDSPHGLSHLSSISLYYQGNKYLGYLHLLPKDYDAENVFVLGAERAYENFVKDTRFDEKYFKSVERAQRQVADAREVAEDDVNWESLL